jgi:hypothetical protein
MPARRHDKLFGGQPGAAKKALENMRRTYGPKKGQQVFDAIVIKRERRTKRPPRKR